MTDLASQNTLQRSQIDILMERIYVLEKRYESDYDDINTLMCEFWGLLYPDGPDGWEYPGQVLNHIRVELERHKS